MARKKAEAHKVIVADRVHDGAGGYYPIGHLIEAPADIASLKAKGLVA